MDKELAALEKAIEDIAFLARRMGLDFFPVCFELCPADVIYTFGAYGMPTRFSHWSFGKHFHRLKMQYDYNLSRIYELVINSDPCYAFLLEGNSLVQNKLVIAHVFAHSDFFKNNCYFRHTSRKMVETMAVHAAKIREYEFIYGRREVEIFLDAAMVVQEHIEPPSPLSTLSRESEGEEEEGDYGDPNPESTRQTPYDDLWALDRTPVKPKYRERHRKTPPRPCKDVIGFIMRHSSVLEDWQRDILAMLREEMLYFWPQLQTKIMNEGWATYWHVRIMRELDLPEEEAVEFARLNALVLQPAKTHINPYYVGLKIFEDIERRWDGLSGKEDHDNPGPPKGRGREKIFEVRSLETDVSFLRNYLTKELVEELDLYLYERVGGEWVVVEKDWEKVRDTFVSHLLNCGHPYIVVDDADYDRRGELYLKHYYEGLELDVPYLEKALQHVYLLWGRPVHLETVVDGKKTVFSYDGKKSTRRS
ncbi:MAG: SpoVR family protein [Thermanaeromonas sp.]|uniref:SpoVR family protein n=1 Tax=Thermanaeromonas sp. TaxID=2003697 RepID=UPI0024407D98|nr:SpoVR family protein [Thermanaeromonas sp.]MCG0278401.1 SpoVR family protein [Thermanaeromonas sp.]